MGANPLQHSDEYDSSILMGHNVSRMSPLSLLTDADVLAATTVDGLITAIEANIAGQHVDQDWSTQGERALDYSEALGDITDAVVAASSTVQDLVDATSADGDGLYQTMTIE